MPVSDAELLFDVVREAGELGLTLGRKKDLKHWTKPDGSHVTEGDLAINPQSYNDYGADPDSLRHHPEARAAWNLGEVMGLRGLTSLLPLLALWVLAALLLL